ncbi:Diacylglycerol lipase-alpha [Geodia barretti]|uniref:sn-1-specific diacylglycerol lipase n=1 Tax=Geodia barretti TaxID=519541 RepID=A0AA35U281_GEOBA|nr:Diacylglycerol lipase-alpha [Geodia barretti]
MFLTPSSVGTLFVLPTQHIFRQMSTRSEEDLIPEGYDSSGNRSLHQVSHPAFDKELKDYIVLDDLMHFCHYALGVYGWPLYLYENLDCGTGCCGLTACCRLTAKTCGGCYCRRLSKRRANGDVMADNLCFCGFASVQLMSPDQSLRKDDIKHLTFENEYFECPYLLCVDHAMKAVVVCVRGTLSFKDVLTDITVSVKKLTKEDVGDKFNVPGAYVHRGMYRTAKGIRDQLLSPDKPILTNTLGDYEKDHYRLVIVGHSLGAGVASILAILLKDYFPDLICYAYSPPGCVFSFPLVQYSKDFITSVVIGNDMVARLSIRALHYMKREIEALLKKCKKPKHQVIFQPRYCDRLCGMCTREVEDPSVSMVDIEHKLSREDSEEEEMREPMSLPPRPALNRADSIISWACCGKKHLKAPKKPAVKKVTRRQRVPTFAPGSILHLTVKQKQKPSCLGPCYVLKVTPEWIHSEDLGVIIADRGMIEDHMPTRVMEVLRTYHREVSVQTGLVFTKDVVSAERRKTTNDEIRNLIQKRSYFDLPVRGRLDSDGKSWRRAMQAGEDEPDGAVEGIDEENDERVRVMMDEPVESSAEDELLPSSPDTANRLYKGTAIDIEENQLTHAEQQNELIASNDRDDPEEIELTVERYGGEGYTELAPTETLL